MKKIRITYLIIACLFIGGSLHAQVWKAKAISDLNKGEFAKVEQTISKLSEAEKGKHAWLIDSLQAMMSRIRDDFRLSREEGKKLLLEKVPGATDKQIESWKQKKYLETRIIESVYGIMPAISAGELGDTSRTCHTFSPACSNEQNRMEQPIQSNHLTPL